MSCLWKHHKSCFVDDLLNAVLCHRELKEISIYVTEYGGLIKYLIDFKRSKFKLQMRKTAKNVCQFRTREIRVDLLKEIKRVVHKLM